MTIALRAITSPDDPALESVRQFFRNYAGWLGVDLGFQGFAEEMAALPGCYAPPRGRLWCAELSGRPVGCVGVRPISDGVCELKRLYVEPDARGQGVGQELALAAIRAAKELGYRRILLDTLPAMRMAVKLYRDLGFREAPAYYTTPLEGTIFLSLDLENWSEDEVRDEHLLHLFDFNRAWARQMRQVDPGYFEKLARLQAPELFWIGCSDSRVPANQIVGLLPGEVFVHRNLANQVVHSDLNCLSVIQFAVEVLAVRHVMVVGHYGCGGVQAALTEERIGLADIWLRHVRDVRARHRPVLDALPEGARHGRLCELNALEQARNVCETFVVQDAWARGQKLTVHAWIYGLADGLMRDLGLTVSGPGQVATKFAQALEGLGG
jgi:carbonic anhydrase